MLCRPALCKEQFANCSWTKEQNRVNKALLNAGTDRDHVSIAAMESPYLCITSVWRCSSTKHTSALSTTFASCNRAASWIGLSSAASCAYPISIVPCTMKSLTGSSCICRQAAHLAVAECMDTTKLLHSHRRTVGQHLIDQQNQSLSLFFPASCPECLWLSAVSCPGLQVSIGRQCLLPFSSTDIHWVKTTCMLHSVQSARCVWQTSHVWTGFIFQTYDH